MPFLLWQHEASQLAKMEKCKVDAMLIERAGLKDEEVGFCWILDFSWQCHCPALPSPQEGREQFSNNTEETLRFCARPFLFLGCRKIYQLNGCLGL